MRAFRYHNEVAIDVEGVRLKGELIMPMNAGAMVIFSHGSGSSHRSLRNKKVAEQLHLKNFGTLLFDLLTEAEDEYYPNRFNTALLTDRLVAATRWLEGLPGLKNCPIGYFGASTGAASALKAAARLPEIGAVVSRGGRPDMARDALTQVEAPVLLIVGSLDQSVLKLNKEAYDRLPGMKRLEVIEGASHLFEENGTMDLVARLAASWFEEYLHPVKAC